MIYLNEWLSRQGYLKWTDDDEVQDVNGKLTADRLKDHLMMIDWKNTIAYCPTPSSNAIYVRKAGDSSFGVKPEDYADFCLTLKQQLLDYQNPADGGQIFVEVDLNEARMAGRPCIEYAPDLIVKLRDCGFVSILQSPEVVIPRAKPEGTHRPNGIFIARGPDVKVGEQVAPLSILDITPLILNLLGVAVPTDLEGRVPTEILHSERLASVRYEGVTQSQPRSNRKTGEASEEEKAALMSQLKLLGYME